MTTFVIVFGAGMFAGLLVELSVAVSSIGRIADALHRIADEMERARKGQKP